MREKFERNCAIRARDDEKPTKRRCYAHTYTHDINCLGFIEHMLNRYSVIEPAIRCMYIFLYVYI